MSYHYTGEVTPEGGRALVDLAVIVLRSGCPDSIFEKANHAIRLATGKTPTELYFIGGKSIKPKITRADGTVEEISSAAGDKFTMNDFRRILQIERPEVIEMDAERALDGILCVIEPDGIASSKKHNKIASLLTDQPVYGDCLFLGKEQYDAQA